MQVKKFPALNCIWLSLGLPQAMYVTKADVTDRNGAIEMFISISNKLAKVQNMLVDSGYSGDNFANAIKNILDCSVEVVKKSDLHSFKVKALDSVNLLGLNVDFGCERKFSTSKQMTVLALLTLVLRRF